MTPIPKFHIQLLILLSLLFLAVTVVHAQESEGISREAFYNSADGFHVLIPPGWENQSSEQYAHFVHSQTGVNIYADSAATTDVQAGINEVISLVVPDFAGEPTLSGEVILSNGTWTQNVYQPDDEASLTAYGQVYEGSTYVVVWYSPQSAVQPVIVAGEDAQAGIREALTALGYAADTATATEELEVGEQVWTRAIYEDAAGLGRVRGASTLVIVKSGAPAEDDAALPVFFNLLTGFFITPATAPYLYLGLAAAAVISLVFIGSLILRGRNLRKDIETLEALDADQRATA